MKSIITLTLCLIAFSTLSGCRNTCGERKGLFHRDSDREGFLSRRRNDDSNSSRRTPSCDDCMSPVSRTGYPAGLQTPEGTMMPYLPGSLPVVPGTNFSNDPRVLPQPMPNIPSPGVPESPLAQPLPTGPSSILPMPNTGPGRAVSK